MLDKTEVKAVATFTIEKRDENGELIETKTFQESLDGKEVKELFGDAVIIDRN